MRSTYLSEQHKRGSRHRLRTLRVGPDMGASSSIVQIMLLGPLISLLGSKKLGLLFHEANEGLNELGVLLNSGKINPVIDRCFPFSEIIDALRYYGNGNARGKVVVSMTQDSGY